MKEEEKTLKNKINTCSDKTRACQNNGITLVALVITIIVMLILAGVAISALVGDGGIISKAQNAAEIYNQSAQNEADTINKLLYGNGTKDNPYKIGTAEDLKNLADSVNNGNNYEGIYFEIENNIDLGAKWDENNILTEGKQWVAIGTSNNRFEGNFNANNYKIGGIYISNENLNNQGLFGVVGEKGTIENLEVNGYVYGNTSVAGIVGYNYGEIKNCINRVDTVAKIMYAGGIVANNEGLIYRCINYAHVIGGSSSNVGGIAARNGNTAENKSIIKECINYGKVDHSGTWNCGGIVGMNGYGEHAYIYSCINYGDINGVGDMGGIVGNNGELNNGYGYIYNCYNTAKISNMKENVPIGGIVGQTATLDGNGYVYNSYNIGVVNGYNNSSQGSVVGNKGSGVTVIENCYGLEGTNANIGAGDFKTEQELKESENVLNIGQEPIIWIKDTVGINNGYPILAWQMEI